MKPLVYHRPGDSLADRIVEAEDGTLLIVEVDSREPTEQTALARLVRMRSWNDDTRPEVRVLMRARIIATGARPLQEFSPFDPVFKDFRVHLPSLRERKNEFSDIVSNLLVEMAHELRRDHVREISPEAMALLRKHEWRANLRELRNVLRYAVLNTSSGVIDERDLPDLRDPHGHLILDRTGFAEIERSIPH